MPNLSSAALEIEEFAKSARKLAKYAKQVRIDNTGFESNCTLSKISPSKASFGYYSYLVLYLELDPCAGDVCNGNVCKAKAKGGVYCDCSTTGMTGPTCDTGT